MSAEVADVLEKAAQVIEKRGWTQHAYFTQDGAHCLVGALEYASGGYWAVGTHLAYRAVSRAVRAGAMPLSYWNDRPSRTADEVIAALRNAAAAERDA